MRLCLSCVLVACGCSGVGPVDVDGDDSTSFPTLRVQIPLGDAPTYSNEGTGWSDSIEVGITGVEGNDTQDLAFGEILDLGAGQFTGPATVASDLDVRQLTVAFRRDLRTWTDEGGAVFGILAGLGSVDSEIELLSGATRLTDAEQEAYVWGGLELAGDVSERLRLHGRMVAPLIGGTMIGEIELGLSFRLGTAVSLFGGWRYWDYFWTRPGSDVEYRFDGPMFGVRVNL